MKLGWLVPATITLILSQLPHLLTLFAIIGVALITNTTAQENVAQNTSTMS